jgi:hypothetical protein
MDFADMPSNKNINVGAPTADKDVRLGINHRCIVDSIIITW